LGSESWICSEIDQVKRSFRSPKRREEDNIKMDLKEMGWEGVDWNHLA
jgi:hypothetical protein